MTNTSEQPERTHTNDEITELLTQFRTMRNKVMTTDYSSTSLDMHRVHELTTSIAARLHKLMNQSEQ